VASGNTTGGVGAIFQVTLSGAFTSLYQLHGSDGATPIGGLMQATNGTLYGTTTDMAEGVAGTVFSFSMGLGPFVRTVPTSGSVGRNVRILGTDLTGSTSVTFNGTRAEFTVVSATEINATVPTGATTGTIEVTTPRETLKSNVPFRVL
jgi:hypothetical protein